MFGPLLNLYVLGKKVILLKHICLNYHFWSNNSTKESLKFLKKRF